VKRLDLYGFIKLIAFLEIISTISCHSKKDAKNQQNEIAKEFERKGEQYQLLKEQIKTADSVVLISHILTKEFSERSDKRNTSIYPSYLNAGRVNSLIVKERKTLDILGINKLAAILAQNIKPDGNSADCDMPHHSILIYKQNRESYIDISFSCSHIHTSPDILFNDSNIDTQKWKNLMAFFKQNNITGSFIDN